MSELFEKIGSHYNHYQLKKRFHIAELSVVLNVIEHTPSGAQIIHIDADDPENVFCLSFKTLPTSSNGVAHILEHTVLCGSDKFPVKDPFFAMQKRSLNTFMNALTGSDFTCYPAASLNKKDFYNLLEVYLDAVFHPKLLENSFLQEGHRLEFANKDDPTTPLEIKGIVYNEMKGAMGSSDSRLWHAILKELTPDLTYAHNSGGDPKEIIQLSYQELKDFYQQYYHPSRCLFYFYGNFPLKNHLDFIDQMVLHDIKPVPPLTYVKKQHPFSSPKIAHIEIPAPKSDDLTQENVISFGYLTCEIENQLDLLALTVLDSYLMDTDNSILKKALLDSGLCDAIDSYMDPEMTQVPYVIFCRGVKLEDHEKIKNVIEATFKTVSETGISKKDLASSLHQLELSRTEISGEGNPFGLTLFMRSALNYQHGVSPEKGLIFHELFNELNALLETKTFIQSLVEKYFIQNKTRVDILGKASSSLLEKEAFEETQFLIDLKNKLTDEQKQALVEKAQKLHQFQKMQEHQDIECLPKISLSDVDRNIRSYVLDQKIPGLYTFEGFTNGMVYADTILSFDGFTEEELKLLPILASLITEVGVKDFSFEKTLEDMHAFTGGISASCNVLTDVENPSKVLPVITLKGKSLKRNVGSFLELLYNLTYHPRFDELKRLEDLINQLYATLQNKFARQAMRYASNLALSQFSASGKIAYLFYGLPFYEKIKQLKADGAEGIQQLSLALKALYKKWLKNPLCELMIVSDKGTSAEMRSFALRHFSHLIAFDIPNQEFKFEKGFIKEAHLIPASVAFNIKAFNTQSYADPSSSDLLVASSILENVYLHHDIREIGGAYGAGANYMLSSGSFYFHSYRDPHIAATFFAYEKAQENLIQGNFCHKELEEAKICIIQQLDMPLNPLAKAMVAYTHLKEKRTPLLRQNFRDRILSSTKEDIEKTASIYLNPDQKASFVTFAGADIWKKDEEVLKKKDLLLAVIPL